jgi:K+-transporting ATPase ATPase A chain
LLPLNPEGLGAVRWDTALNTAVSFVTNTNWQSYSGETTMSYLTQMLGLTVQNFLSAAMGIAVAIAFLRAFIKKETATIGNFWVDLTRSIVYILLPLLIVYSLIFVSQGTIQNLNPYTKAHTVQGQEQLIAQGPVASQESIKMLGTNGGGFFNANSAHPYENPTPLTDYLQILGLLVISAALPFTFGALMNNQKQGWAIFLAMGALYLMGLGVALWSEFHGNPVLSNLGIEHGLNMEGKEVRFGILNSVLFGHSTTVTSCGAINAMHDSMMPMTGLIFMFNR